jgi:hypothetical protein
MIRALGYVTGYADACRLATTGKAHHTANTVGNAARMLAVLLSCNDEDGVHRMIATYTADLHAAVDS